MPNSRSPVLAINWRKIEEYIRVQLGLEAEKGQLEVEPLTTGYSNLTFKIRLGNWQGILRRPPFGELPKKAHDMEREYSILKSIHPVYPKAPLPLLYCDTQHVLDKHFYIMELKKGIVIDDSLPLSWDTNQIKEQISKAFIEELSSLHSIDISRNKLEHLGKANGFLERQVHGWIKRYHATMTSEDPPITRLEKWFLENAPESRYTTIVHNDFKLNNLMFHQDHPPKITALLDWEMSTIGDPLFDLGVCLAYWKEEGEGETGLTSVTDQQGFLKRKDLLELYAKATGFDLGHINFYLSFAFYKIAVVLQQLYYRYKIGETNDTRFADLDKGIKNLLLHAENTAFSNPL